jgi:hypothetical protein
MKIQEFDKFNNPTTFDAIRAEEHTKMNMAKFADPRALSLPIPTTRPKNEAISSYRASTASVSIRERIKHG